MLLITEKAANKIKEISDNEGIGYYSVRVKLAGGGCAGLTRSIEFEEVSRGADLIIELDEVKVFVDEISAQYMKDATLDYKDGLSGGFYFDDPNITYSCGCKNSVGY